VHHRSIWSPWTWCTFVTLMQMFGMKPDFWLARFESVENWTHFCFSKFSAKTFFYFIFRAFFPHSHRIVVQKMKRRRDVFSREKALRSQCIRNVKNIRILWSMSWNPTHSVSILDCVIIMYFSYLHRYIMIWKTTIRRGNRFFKRIIF
jgi:hypothetical protein